MGRDALRILTAIFLLAADVPKQAAFADVTTVGEKVREAFPGGEVGKNHQDLLPVEASADRG